MKHLFYRSTRGDSERVTSSMAILQGLAPDGGLFVPEALPSLAVPLEALADMSYQETAYEVMRLFLTDFTEEELKDCIRRAYDDKFDTEEIAPLVKVGELYHLELFHGATIAFKDMALSVLPHLMKTAAEKNGIEKELVILTATSGDTGKAALAGFAGVEGTRIIVFYPKDGVSRIQELQMVTQQGANTAVVAVHGSFDDAQSGVKEMFENEALRREMCESGRQFSSANSINIGRLVPQIVYYVYALAKLLKYGEIKPGEQIDVTVPTGNFGNILAAYYAKQMGLPIRKLVCASNDNHVLTDFFRTGSYNKNREFLLTSSPSMDILVSSNLERLIYLISGCDAGATKRRMDELKRDGKYTITDGMREMLGDFEAGFASEREAAETIREKYRQTGYLMDTHTAVAVSVAEAYRETAGKAVKMLVASTASPYKFPGSVMAAVDASCGGMEAFALIDRMSECSGVPVPRAVEEIRTAKIVHDRECDADKMTAELVKLLRLKLQNENENDCK